MKQKVTLLAGALAALSALALGLTLHSGRVRAGSHDVGPNPICTVIIDEDGIDVSTSTIQQAAASHAFDPNLLVNDDFPTVDDNPPLRWNELFPGDVVLLPAGRIDDEGWFALPVTIPWSLEEFVAGTVPQEELGDILDVMPLRNQDLVGLVGRTCVAVVYDGDIVMSYGPIAGNLQGPRYGVFSFTVLAVEVPGSIPESWPTTSLYTLWVRVEAPLDPTERFDVPARDHPADSIQVVLASYNIAGSRLEVFGVSEYAPDAVMTVSLDGADAGTDPAVDPFILEEPMTYNPAEGRYEVTLTTPKTLAGSRVLISTDQGGSFQQNLTRPIRVLGSSAANPPSPPNRP